MKEEHPMKARAIDEGRWAARRRLSHRAIGSTLLLVGGLLSGCPGSQVYPFMPDGSAGEPEESDSGSHQRADSGIRSELGPICETKTFQLQQSQESFEVPDNVTFMHVKAWGAGGNGEGQCGAQDDGGQGGYTEAVFKVDKGMKLVILVGLRGRAGLTNEERVRFGFGEWGGGGLSGVFRGPGTITDKSRDQALLIAGGGGSAGAPGCHPGGTGNHKSAGGMATMLGGKGGDGMNGGAGGYEGGKGGAKGQPSLGGKGFVAKDALSSLLLSTEPGSGAPPRSDDPDYDGQAGKTERSGRIVIHFSCQQPTIKPPVIQ
jgi:hypothetical protein